MSSTGKVALSRLGAHIICWLACHQKGGTVREISVALFKERGREDEQRRLVEDELAAFKQAGFVKPAARIAFIVATSGHRTALELLHWTKLPANANWRVVKSRLEACFLEEKTPPAKETGVVALPPASSDEAAMTLASAFKLTVGSSASLPQVIEALAWHAIGVKTSEPFTVQAVIQVLLTRLAGASALLPLDQAIALLVTKAAAPAPLPVALPADDSAFAARVLAAARASKTGRFGDDKVFISHVLQQLAGEGVAVGDEGAFKDRLVSVHRRGLLSLSRADLVEAMDAKDVDASEARYLSATFHFVRI